MGGARVRTLTILAIFSAAAVVITPDGGAAASRDTGEGPRVIDEAPVAEPAEEQRNGRADVPDPPPNRPIPDPPPGLDMRRPSLGPGGLHLPRDAPDPHMLVVDNRYYLFTTNTSAGHVPVWTSTDLVAWEAHGDALPVLPGWAAGGGATWAPTVHQMGSAYNLYFSARHTERGRFCIGVATSAEPAGPFRARGGPLVCQTKRGGSIDPSLFSEGSARYLLYKTDGNCCGLRSKLWSQRLTGDGLARKGRPSELMFSAAEWEEGVIEGPTMVKRAGRYHLFYSGNWWNTHFYAVGHAVCEGVGGPCHRSSEAPFMLNRSDGVGFGGPSVWESSSGEVWMSYHGWFGPGVGYENGGVRAAFAHRLDFPDWAPPPLCFGRPATLIGSKRADVLTGTGGPDVIVGGGGADTIDGRGGDDLICAGGGHDKVRGGRGDDRIRGQAGRDSINGDGGRDFVDAGPHNDQLRGGFGRDRLWGGGGSDVCWGEQLRCETKFRTNHKG